MLGIQDIWVFLGYMLSILSALACVVYGIINWNKGAEKEKEQVKEELDWEEEEREINENF